LEFTEQTAGTSINTAESEHQDILEGSSPSETKEETTDNSFKALDIGALAILELLPAPVGKAKW
jgi:hypothetical protein